MSASDLTLQRRIPPESHLCVVVTAQSISEYECLEVVMYLKYTLYDKLSPNHLLPTTPRILMPPLLWSYDNYSSPTTEHFSLLIQEEWSQRSLVVMEPEHAVSIAWFAHVRLHPTECNLLLSQDKNHTDDLHLLTISVSRCALGRRRTIVICILIIHRKYHSHCLHLHQHRIVCLFFLLFLSII